MIVKELVGRPGRITSRGEGVERIVTAPGFVSRFALKGEKLKNVPRGYDKEHPQAEYLKYKSWYLERPVSDETLTDPSRLLDEIVPQFEAMQPFNAFLNEALDGFVMPARRY